MSQGARYFKWKVARQANWHCTPTEDAVLYGEPLFCSAIAQQLNILLLEPGFDWLGVLNHEFKKRDVKYFHLRDVKFDSPKFVKPAAEKAFKAKVYETQAEFETASAAFPPSCPVLVQEPLEWEVEFRFFVKCKKIMTSCVYLRNGERTDEASEKEINASKRFLKKVLKNIDIPPGVVIDVGKIKDRGWAIVEANPAWGSGLYTCSPHRALLAVQAAQAPDHSKWVQNYEF